VGASDLDEAYKSISAETSETLDKVKDYYKKEELVNNLREKIKEGKTIKFLLDNAEVTEIEK
ncbi:MAG: hypothetical protein Q8Q87_03110, partial [Candidatus Omnitrophota bacterium]|nr:hypothetical protein [Candidatus Omnitrophota bacterium]